MPFKFLTSIANGTAMILSGIRVLDFGRYIAGPSCAVMLADLGAEVIRIEKLRGSEDRYVQPVTDGDEGTLFLHLNRNKHGLTLNPLKPEGREIVAKLVASSDVVVVNLPEEGLVQMGLDYPNLVKYKPDIILASISAFGSKGPYASRTGFDAIAQAMSGASMLTGEVGNPTKSYASWVDYVTSSHAAFGVMAALRHRDQTGEGQVVSTNLLHSALTVMHSTTMEEALANVGRQASGNRVQLGGPSDMFNTKDGKIVLSVFGDPLFKRWATLMDEEHWLSDPRFTTDNDRGVNGALLSQRTQRWARQFTTAEALALLEQAKIPAGPVLSAADILTDEYVGVTDTMVLQEYPGLDKPVPMLAPPVTFSKSETPLRMPPPSLGEHTNDILHWLGYSDADIQSMIENGVV